MVMAGCEPGVRSETPDAIVEEVADAAVDAFTWDPGYVPVTVTGYTPAGSVDPLRHALARYAGTWCGDMYEIELSPTRTIGATREEPYLVFTVPMSTVVTEPAVGPLPASATVWQFEEGHGARGLAHTEDVTFEAELLEPPMVEHATVRGRLVTSAPGWRIDLDVDLVSIGHHTCQ